MKRWKGLASLVTDAVAHGAGAVEKVHLATARRTFDILEKIPVVAAPAAIVHVVYDLSTMAAYASVRGTARVVGKAVEIALEVADPEARIPESPEP